MLPGNTAGIPKMFPGKQGLEKGSDLLWVLSSECFIMCFFGTVGHIHKLHIYFRVHVQNVGFFSPLILETSGLDSRIIWSSVSYVLVQFVMYRCSRTYGCRASETWPHTVIPTSSQPLLPRGKEGQGQWKLWVPFLFPLWG